MTGLEIRADGIGVDAGGRIVLDNIDLRATAGGVLGLSGPSGSGKTTLLHVLAGILRPTRGHVSYLGGSTNGFGPGRAALVLQGFGLAPTLTATENVALPLLAAGRSGAAAAEPCRAALARFGLTDVGAQLVGDLSGGQRQRVAIARAVARRAELILADEPTAAVDTTWRDTILEVLGQEADRGAIVLIASHDPVVLATCTEVIELADGRRVAPTQVE